MNCLEALDAVLEEGSAEGPARRAQADAHIRQCDECQSVTAACAALGLERALEPPAAPPGALDRAVRAAIRAHAAGSKDPRNFVRGMLVGATVAASVTAVVFGLLTAPVPAPTVGPAGGVTPQISMALNESRAVSIALDAAAAMAGAEIHVLVSGDVALDGYGGQRELRWTTDLAPGSNQLTIPVVAIGGAGGQLLVEVEHDMRQRRFLVDIAGAG